MKIGIQNKNFEIQKWPGLMQSADTIPIDGPSYTNIIEYNARIYICFSLLLLMTNIFAFDCRRSRRR